MGDEIAIKLNREIQNLIQTLGGRDPDQFGLRLSRELAGQLQRGLTPREAVAGALASTKTLFFKANGLHRMDFQDTLERRVGGLGLRSVVLPDRIRHFCSFAERQLANELWANRNDEGFLRGHLQTFLEAGTGRTLKEVATGRGKADIGLLHTDPREVIETKLWKGIQYFRDGLVELSEYLRTENLRRGFYVVLDCSLTNELVEERGHTWSEHVGGQIIHVFFIRVSPASPSKLGRHRRKTTPS